MANIVVTTAGDALKAVFNDYAATIGMKSGRFNRTSVIDVTVNDAETAVQVHMSEGSNIGKWVVSYDGSAGTLQVDSIDGVAPTSNEDLADKIAALIIA